MSFQAYLDRIEAKTGKTPTDFSILARKKGLLEPGVKAGRIIDWLKKDFGLGRGHAMAIVLAVQSATRPTSTVDERVVEHFAGKNAVWRKPYDSLIDKIRDFGPDVSVSPTHTYISLLRNGKKFAIIRVSSQRIDIGIKLNGAPPSGRLETAGRWNSMVTHRVRIGSPPEIDRELMSWLGQAYEKAQREGPISRERMSGRERL